MTTEVLTGYLADYRLTQTSWVAAYALLLYNWFLTLDDEVEFMWSGRWNWIRILFFMNRYWPLAYLPYCITVLFLEKPTPDACTFSYSWFIWATLLSHVVVTIIFIKRIHAMYDGNRTVLTAMILVEVTLLLAQTILSGLISSATRLTPASGMLGCVPSRWVLRPWVYWIPAGLLENLLFLLVAVKSIRCAMGLEQYNADLLIILLRDSVFYFGGLCVILTANIVVWTAGRETLFVALSETVPVFHSIVGCRMLTNIRKEAEPWRAEPWRDRDTAVFSAMMRSLRVLHTTRLSNSRGLPS